MSQTSTLLTILMDRKTHTREELLSLVYRKVRGTHSGRLAARIEDLRKKGFSIESPKIKYVNGRMVKVHTKGFKKEQRSFWYKLLGSKTEWKSTEEKWQQRLKKLRALAAKKAVDTKRKANLLDEE